MPFWATLTHAILQIVTVGLGSPLGREVAPRELGAALATKLCVRANLTPECTRVMIACGAGAGFAAVYNVPLGGALFTLEVLLGTFSLPASVAALATYVIATLVAWLGLRYGLQYSVPPLAISSSIIVWSLLARPVIGAAAYLFVRVTEAARARAPREIGVWLSGALWSFQSSDSSRFDFHNCSEMEKDWHRQDSTTTLVPHFRQRYCCSGLSF